MRWSKDSEELRGEKVIDYIIRIYNLEELERIVYTSNLFKTLEFYQHDELRDRHFKFEIQPVEEGYLYND